MRLPIGSEFTTVLTVTELRFVTCESCDSTYVYRMVHAASGKGSSILWLDNKRAKERSTHAASQSLKARQCSKGVVYCPNCGWCQAEMTQEARLNAGIPVGCLGGIAAIILALIGGFVVYYRWVSAASGVRLQNPPDPTWWFVGALCVGALSVVAAKLVAKSADPNRGTGDERARRARDSVGVLCSGRDWIADFLERQPELMFSVGNLPSRTCNQQSEAGNHASPRHSKRLAQLCEEVIMRVASGDLERALFDPNEAVAMAPGFGEVYNLRGAVHIASAQLAERAAEAPDLDRMLAEPLYVATYGKRPRSQEGHPNYGKAVEDCRKAIELDPHNGAAYVNMGIAYYGLGEHRRAIEAFTAALQVNPNLVSAYHNRAVAYEAAGDFTQAIVDHGEAIRLRPGSQVTLPEAWFYNSRGVTHAKAGNFNNAMRDFDEAIGEDPIHEAVQNRELVRRAK